VIAVRLASVLLPLAIMAWSQAAAAVPSAETGTVELSAQVDRHTVPLDGDVQLTVEVTWTGGADRYRFGWPETPRTYHLAIAGSKRSAESWVDDDGTHARQAFVYVLQPTDLGEASIGGVRLTYWAAGDTASAGRTLQTMPVKLKVTAPAEPPRGVSAEVVAFFVLLAAGLGVWRYRARKSTREQPPAEPGEGAGLLTTLRKARADGDVPAFYDAALAVVRYGVEDRFGIGAGRMTALELAAAVGEVSDDIVEREGLSGDDVLRLRELLEQIDRRRFAPTRTESWELDSAMEIATKLLDSKDG
jgi:hypothetical protein